jgi:hypothetical protein
MTGDCRTGDDVAGAPQFKLVRSATPTAGAGNAGVRRTLGAGCWAALGDATAERPVACATYFGACALRACHIH